MAFCLQVPKLCIDLDPTLLYILIWRKYGKLERNYKILALGIYFLQTCSNKKTCRAAAATHPSFSARTGGSRSEPVLVRTRPVCKYRVRHWKMGLWQPPSGRSHAHFAEHEQEPILGTSMSRILGMGSHTKILGMGFEMRRSVVDLGHEGVWWILFFVLVLPPHSYWARQLHQERTQVVCSNKVAWKRLARRHSRSGPWTHERCFEVDVFVCPEFM